MNKVPGMAPNKKKKKIKKEKHVEFVLKEVKQEVLSGDEANLNNNQNTWLLRKIYDELFASKERNQDLEQRISKIGRSVDEAASRVSEETNKTLIAQNEKINDQLRKLREENQMLRGKMNEFNGILLKNSLDYNNQLSELEKRTNDAMEKIHSQMNKFGEMQWNSNNNMGQVLENTSNEVIGKNDEKGDNAEESEENPLGQAQGEQEDVVIPLNGDGDNNNSKDEPAPNTVEMEPVETVVPEVETVRIDSSPTPASSDPSSSEPQSSDRFPKFPCIFCDDNRHTSSRCMSYKTPLQRKQRLRAKNICVRCLQPNNVPGYKAHYPCSKVYSACPNCPYSNVYDDMYHHPLICPIKNWNNFWKNGNKGQSHYNPYPKNV